MLPDRVSNPGPLTYESGALPIALRGPAKYSARILFYFSVCFLDVIYSARYSLFVLMCRKTHLLLFGIGSTLKRKN